MKTIETLRFGLLISSIHQMEAWQVDTIERLCAVPGVECVLVLQDVHSDAVTGGTATHKHKSGQHNLRCERYVHRVKRQCNHLQKRLIPNFLTTVPLMVYRSTARFSDEVPADFAAYHVDFILSFSPDVPPAALIDQCPIGVWSFSYHGVDANAAVWQAILNREYVVKVPLWRYSTGLSADVVEEGVIAVTKHSYVETLNKVYAVSRDWPALVCRKILNGQIDKQPWESVNRTIDLPSSSGYLRLRFRLWWNILIKLYQALQFEQWNIGVARVPIAKWMETGPYDEIEWFPLGKTQTFLADPFAMQTKHGDLTVLAEEYEVSVGRGVISALTFTEGPCQGDREGRIIARDFEASHILKSKLTTSSGVIRLPVHMSYPYLFEHNGDIYCIPETYQAGRVDLYRAKNFPTDWEKVTTLLNGFAGIDSTVFQYGGRWWLLCTDGKRDPHGSLCAWYADDLFGPWSPHMLNPIKTDVRGSRPAGRPFWHEGELYRPAQDCSETYGGKITIQKILALTPTEFHETVVRVIQPAKAGPYRKGIHTVCEVGEYTVIDGKRRFWSLPYLQFKLRGFATKAAARFRKSVSAQSSPWQKS